MCRLKYEQGGYSYGLLYYMDERIISVLIEITITKKIKDMLLYNGILI